MSLSIKIYIDGVLTKIQQGIALPAEGSTSSVQISGIQYANANTGLSWNGNLSVELIRTLEQVQIYQNGDYSGMLQGSFLKIGTISFAPNGLWVLGTLGIAPWDEEYNTGTGIYRHYASAEYDGDDDENPETVGTPYSGGVQREYFYNPSSNVQNFTCTFVGGTNFPVSLSYKKDGGEIPCKGEALYRRDYTSGDYWQYYRTWEMDEIRLYFYLPKIQVYVRGDGQSAGAYFYSMPIGNVPMPSVAGLMPPADRVFRGWQWNRNLYVYDDGDAGATAPWPFNPGDVVSVEDCSSNANITDYKEIRLQPDKSDTTIGGGKYRYPLRRNDTGGLPTSPSESGLPTKTFCYFYPLWHTCSHKIVVDDNGNPVVTSDGKLIVDE